MIDSCIITNEVNNINYYSVSELNYIRESIEMMHKFNQLEVLKILAKTQLQQLKENENKYGNHINLSKLNKEVLDELMMYINYVNMQEKTLNQDEQQKMEFKNTYFIKN